ncbi:MAG: HlyD family efflux transporter periplasmic adaptor subunit [Deltaproteobacteria bacterium]|nr:HlyD family efflux transporter periplasmic adaptor subunit [Deltaproteobacteria bacterium]
MSLARKIGIAVAAVALVAGAVVVMAPKPAKVELGRVQRGALQVTVEATGKTRVKERFTVSAPVSGNLTRIELRAGDVVTQGQVLARIAPYEPALLDARTRAEAEARVAVANSSRAEAEAAVERARVARDQAVHELGRVRKLAESNAIAPEVLDSAEFAARGRERELASVEAALQSARRGVDAARATLVRGGSHARKSSDAEVTTPTRGRILRVVQQSEGPVQAGTPLLEIGDPTSLEIAADFLTTDAVRIRPDAPVLIDQYGGAAALQGKVRLVEPSAFTKISALGVEEQRVNVIMDPAGKPEDWSVLGDGYQVQVRVVVWEAPSALKVPLSALFRTGGAWNAFVVIQGRSALRTAQIGQRTGSDAEVLGGLVEGDTVILHPSDKLADGEKVAAR